MTKQTRTVAGVVFTRRETVKNARARWSAGRLAVDVLELTNNRHTRPLFYVAGEAASRSADFRAVAGKAIRRRTAAIRRMRGEVAAWDAARAGRRS